MDFQGIGPAGEAGHDIELAEQAGHHFIGVGLPRKVFEVRHHLLQGALDPANGLLGEVLSLSLQALVMFEELFAVELNEGRRSG